MTDLVPVKVGEGATIYVQGSESAPTPGRPKIREAGTAEEILAKAIDTGQLLTGSIREFTEHLAESLRSIGAASRPQRASVEFGLSISAEGNVFVVKGAGEATVTITAEWEWEPAHDEKAAGEQLR